MCMGCLSGRGCNPHLSKGCPHVGGNDVETKPRKLFVRDLIISSAISNSLNTLVFFFFFISRYAQG